MLSYLIQWLLPGVVVIFLVSITTFILLRLALGSPVEIMIGEARATQEQTWGAPYWPRVETLGVPPEP